MSTGLVRVRSCCLFTWRQADLRTPRQVDVRPHHCLECISALKELSPPVVLLDHPLLADAVVGRLGPGPVMVVDDDRAICEAVSDVFGEAGHPVIEAASAAAALAYLRSGAALPRVVFLDLMMPEMDGYELLAELQKDPPLARIPVVVVTAMVPDRERLKDMPILRKPVQLHAVMAALEQHGARAG
jgi:CheY-like chemotaxis protein